VWSVIGPASAWYQEQILRFRPDSGRYQPSIGWNPRWSSHCTGLCWSARMLGLPGTCMHIMSCCFCSVNSSRCQDMKGCLIMPPPTEGGGRRHYVFGLSVRPSVCPSMTQSLCAWYLTRDLTDLYQTWHGNSLWRVDELIRYSRSWGQRSRSYGVIYKNLVCAISRKGFEGSSPNLTWLLPMKSRWTD